MNALIEAVKRYASTHANHDGLAATPIEGLRMMCVSRPTGPMHSIYKPLVCLILQGAKRMTVAGLPYEFHAGQSVVVTLDMPVTGRVMEASPAEPYAAVAIEIDVGLVREVVSELGLSQQRSTDDRSLFAVDTEAAALDCAMRLMRLLDTSAAIPVLRAPIMKELHYWLVEGRHGDAIRKLALPDSQAERLGSAIRLLRTEYRQRLSLERLAAVAGMGVSTFGRRFKAMTSLTPGQFQKQLRLTEARRLMLAEGLAVTDAAFAVGYGSAAHFTKDYVRLFSAPPRRDVRAMVGPGEKTAGS